jgi:precorrin-2 dehydrogenase/sirohydrochlorin ferrochelatase
MKYYPIEINIKERKCVVVGGGKVASRKVVSLLECGGEVHVVSRDLNPSLRALLRAGKIYFHEKEYTKADLKGAFLVVAATDSESVNEKVAKDAHKLKILVNVVDKIELCDFLVPAVTRVGDLTITVSTTGKSPSLAKKIRSEIASSYGKEYGELLNILGKIRSRVQEEVTDPEKRKMVWKKIVSSKAVDLIKKEAWDRLNILIEGIIKEHSK